jgi:hypothetical protein
LNNHKEYSGGEILKSLSGKRGNSAEYHCSLGQKWRKYGEPDKNHNALVYAAFEFRLAIERIVFELHALIRSLSHIPDDEVDKYESITNNITYLMEIVSNQKNLYRLLKFNSIWFHEVTHYRGELSIPDIKILKNFWHGLSDYCHMKIKPDATWESPEWITKAYTLLNEVEKYLWEIKVQNHFAFPRLQSWQPEVLDLLDMFVREEIDERGVITRLRLMSPVIEARYRNKR